MPTLFACLSVQGDEVIIGRLHVEVVMPHPETTIADMGPAPGLPVVMPELMSVAGIDRPAIIRHGDIQNSIYLQRRPLDRTAADENISRTFTADDHGWFLITTFLWLRSC